MSHLRHHRCRMGSKRTERIDGSPVNACLQCCLPLCCLLGQALEVPQQQLLVRHLQQVQGSKGGVGRYSMDSAWVCASTHNKGARCDRPVRLYLWALAPQLKWLPAHVACQEAPPRKWKTVHTGDQRWPSHVLANCQIP